MELFDVNELPLPDDTTIREVKAYLGVIHPQVRVRFHWAHGEELREDMSLFTFRQLASRNLGEVQIEKYGRSGLEI